MIWLPAEEKYWNESSFLLCLLIRFHIFLSHHSLVALDQPVLQLNKSMIIGKSLNMNFFQATSFRVKGLQFPIFFLVKVSLLSFHKMFILLMPIRGSINSFCRWTNAATQLRHLITAKANKDDMWTMFCKKANVVTVFKEEGTAWWRSNDRWVGLIAIPEWILQEIAVSKHLEIYKEMSNSQCKTCQTNLIYF